MMDSLCFKAHKKLDGSTVLVEFFFIAMLRLIARKIVFIVQDGICITCVFLIDEIYRVNQLCI